MDDFLLETKGLFKVFSGVRVLSDIDLRVKRGQVLGIIGENGAGKSTLVKILTGIHAPSSGRIFIEGYEIRHMNPELAGRLGVNMIPQEFNLIGNLNVFENIFLGREYRSWGVFLDKGRMRRKTKELLDELRCAVPVDAQIQDLSVAGKQMVEIAKAVVNDCKILIMDEPTTVLTQDETDILFSLVRRLKEHGTAIVYISHKLAEVKQICDDIMVLKDGCFVSQDPASELSTHEMARRMVGRELRQMFPPKSKPGSEVVLGVDNMVIPGDVAGITFDLRKGEILGFAGLVGAGRTETAEGIYGIRRPVSGSISIGGSKVSIKSPRDAVAHGIAYLSEDRQGRGIHTGFSVSHNTTLISLKNYGKLITDRAKELEKTGFYARSFNIKSPSQTTPLKFLSGGNQQKVALAKGLDPQPRIYIFDEPTRGIDVNARGEIYVFIRRLVEDGISCILISSDLEEVIGLSNRVVVMREGRIAGILEGDQINEEDIMFLAAGVGQSLSA